MSTTPSPKPCSRPFITTKITNLLHPETFERSRLVGRKTGKGYYDYADGADKMQPQTGVNTEKLIFERILVMLINEAADALFWGIASARDIDNAMTLGVNYPKGIVGLGR